MEMAILWLTNGGGAHHARRQFDENIDPCTPAFFGECNRFF
jgi:hypothetical protein